MNIAIILPSLARKGPILVAGQIVNRLVDEDDLCFEVFYFDDIVEVPFNCATRRISLNEEIEWGKYSIIHSHMLRPDFYVWKNRKKIKGMTLTTMHQSIYTNMRSDYSGLKSWISERIWLFFVRSFDKAVMLSKKMEKEYKRYLKNTLVINNGVTDCYAGNKEFDPLRVKLISSTSLIKRKGLEQIIEVLKYDSAYVYLCLGDGPERTNLINLAKRLHVEDKVHMFGFVFNPESYYQQSDIYMMTSYSEGVPLAMLEALSAGLPVVCPDNELFKELLTTNEAEFFTIGDIDSLHAAVKRVISDYQIKRDNARRCYLNKYSITIMAKNYLSLYKDLGSNK
jgi:glycosyltransferase involved in cell wall biosynthesis